MKTKFRGRVSMAALPALTGALLIAATVMPAVAQAQAQASAPETTEARMRRMEAEMRALQRKVFPDGAGKTFGPEITPATTAAPVASVPASTPMTDMMVRLDAVEGQLQRMTAQIEENQNRMNKLEARIVALEPPAPEASTPAMAAPAAPVVPAATAPVSKPAAGPVQTSAQTPGKTTAAAQPPVAKPPIAKPSADRVAAVQAIEKPATGDKAEDEYAYGFRLYDAKFYPEAQQQLTRFVEAYPKSKRLSFARNLLGRAYLDDGKPGTAAQWFLQNYLGDKKGERAPDSLLNLGVAMTRIKDTKRACGAFAELKDVYPAEAAGRLKGQVEAATKGVKCD